MKRDGPFAALSDKNYRIYFAGQAVSFIGTFMQMIAQSWLVLEISHSGTALGAILAAQTLPVLLFGAYGGLLADRLNKRRLLICAQAILGTLALILSVLTFTHNVRLWIIALLAILLGSVNACANPTQQAFILEIVGRERLRSAVSLNSVMVNTARAVGPAIAGVLIAATGVGVCFAVNAVSYVIVILALIALDESRLRASEPVARRRGQLREGLRYVRGVTVLWVPLVMMILIGTLAFEFPVVLPLVAANTFHAGPDAYGLLSSSQGAGAVVGGLLIASRGKTGVRATTVGAFVFGVAMTLAALAPSLTFESGALALVGAASVSFNAVGNSTLQLNSDPSFRGRVMALWTVAFLGSTPIGGPIVGVVSEHLSPRFGLGLGGLACFVAAIVGTSAALIIRNRRERREAQGERDETSELALDTGQSATKLP